MTFQEDKYMSDYDRFCQIQVDADYKYGMPKFSGVIFLGFLRLDKLCKFLISMHNQY